MTTISRFFQLAVIWVAGSLTLANAGPIPVAILGDPLGGIAWNRDIKSKLMATGFFSSIDIFPIHTLLPSVGRLLAYKAVLVFTDEANLHAVALGNNLADYVDAGGGVVTAVFVDSGVPLQGRFDTDDYWAIEPTGAEIVSAELTLGVVHEPDSPLLNRVQTFDGGGSSFHGQGVLNASAVDVAD